MGILVPGVFMEESMSYIHIHVLTALLPFVLLITLGIWGAVMNKACKFKNPPKPWWPYAENPGVALELADSAKYVADVLGDAGTPDGKANRVTAIRLQKFDFVFIPLYVLFFSATAVANGGWFVSRIVIVSGILTGLFDVFEDLQILRMVRGVPASSAKRFGKMKWFFYFITVAAEGSIFFLRIPTLARVILGALLVVIGIAAGIAALKGSFSGILSGAKISMFALFALALAPLLPISPVPIREIAEYAVLMRVPLAVALLLLTLPFISFFTGAKALLRGLFDLTPLSLFVVTLATFALAGTACMTCYVILAHAAERIKIVHQASHSLPPLWLWPLFMIILSLPILIFSLSFSVRQRRETWQLMIAAFFGSIPSISVATGLIYSGSSLTQAIVKFSWVCRLEHHLANTQLFIGYADPGKIRDPWPDHIRALEALVCTLLLYAAVGLYGRWRLGKSGGVPGLCSALMLAMMIAWMLSAVTFFFDPWHIPALAIIGLVGTLTAQSNQSDHFYDLKPRKTEIPAPQPKETVVAGGKTRVIVVAANGGGIQAGAWAAQVLYGLNEDCPEEFSPSLRMISSVSGGSVGNAFFVNWLSDKEKAKRPDKAAAESSLDEVAWGLAWPDFIRALCPWPFRKLIGRGRALETAWRLNSAGVGQTAGHLDDLLSDWNSKVTSGKLPAVVMNATIVETGYRLLLATTRMSGNANGRAEVDATELHTINRTSFDVGIVTAARLSATFPYVTPASRSNGAGPQPHVVDGGYYDNYGMATLVEWLDEALTGARNIVTSVLVIQIHGSPVGRDQESKPETKNRGWFYQAIAPLKTLAAVRSAGQIAHNDIELGLLQDKWAAARIPIHSVPFEFPGEDAPLSWHLTPEEIKAIDNAWCDDMATCRKQVREFLDGSDNLNCGCPRCCQYPSAAVAPAPARPL
jgi:Patatin-like phospholipase